MSNYVVLKPTEAQIVFTADLLREFSALNAGSDVKEHHKEGRFNGLLAEIMIQDILGFDRASVGFDDGSDLTINGLRYDVKCQTGNLPPAKYFDFDVKESTLHNFVDAFLFVRYDRKTNSFYLLGELSKTDFLALATFHKVGSVHEVSGMKYFYDTLSVKYSDMKEVTFA